MKKIILLFIVTGILVGMVTACGSAADGTQKTHDTEISQQLTFDHSETLDYAQKFSIDRYQDDYALVTITDDSRYLVVPEGKVAPDDLDPDIVVIQQPVQNIYLAASAAMDMFVSLDALDSIRFSSLKADGWYIDEAKQAMEAGDILYAGKYSTLVGMVTACGSAADGTQKTHDTEISQQLTFDHSETLDYAQKFSIDRYQDDYALVTITDDSRYLVVPEGKVAPDDLDPDIVVIQQPVQNIYLAASAAMDMFVSLDALDSIRFSSLKADGWYIDEAKQAMEAGDILYAGKYSTPDYEKIVEQNCGLAIENTMILHTPEVKEQLEKFGIHVLVDYSSYEPEPLGRTEWVKLYGLLTGHEAQADKAFAEEKSAFEEVKNSVADEAAQEPKTVAFFYITSNGQANVRKSADYLPKMIELAGGRYIFDSLGDEDDATSTMSMQMEEFYAGAKDADYIIYNSTIEGELSSVDDLLAKSPLFEKFKAVQEGHVYCTSKNLYQSTMSLGTITSDIRRMLTGDDADLTYIYKLE